MFNTTGTESKFQHRRCFTVAVVAGIWACLPV
ncbi:hypothetical protein EcWSU1_02276 [Enterobacter ludwigii]|uniref:Uncharacterized protein n=1 Tax=Enterobacter ludwigii TaxID=299767 RepID=G8LQ63_9ENTR|nr:hypothetical protein EcWSU1_02276 [Enterobacter ludwigii]